MLGTVQSLRIIAMYCSRSVLLSQIPCRRAKLLAASIHCCNCCFCVDAPAPPSVADSLDSARLRDAASRRWFVDDGFRHVTFQHPVQQIRRRLTCI